MNYEEKEMQVRFGKENPFRVPEGYFDQLADRVMAQLPERDQQAEQVTLSSGRRPKSRLVTLRPWLYAAACTIAVVVMGITFYSHNAAEEQSLASTSITNTNTTTTNTESQYIDEAADYVMLDNAEIYACLAEN